MTISKWLFATWYDLLNAGVEGRVMPYRKETAGKTWGDVLEIGYETRCTAPSAFDILLGCQLGVGAYRALCEQDLPGRCEFVAHLRFRIVIAGCRQIVSCVLRAVAAAASQEFSSIEPRRGNAGLLERGAA